MTAYGDLALRLAIRLQATHGITSYLDVIDSTLDLSSDNLTDHVRTELGKCTQLLAVVSEATHASWWVPWEIGIASEKNFPLATYDGGKTSIPDYLRKWPYLRSTVDLDHYAAASKIAASEFQKKRAYIVESMARESSVKDFYRILRGSLGQ